MCYDHICVPDDGCPNNVPLSGHCSSSCYNDTCAPGLFCTAFLNMCVCESYVPDGGPCYQSCNSCKDTSTCSSDSICVPK